MKTELLPNHGPMIARFAFLNGLYFTGNIHHASKDEFFKIWWCLHDLKIDVKPGNICDKYNAALKAHIKIITASIAAYQQGTAQFSDCWECLGWAVAWYFQSKIIS